MQRSVPATLLGSVLGVHLADQVALAALPLLATLMLGADAATVGALVAAQGSAWLIVALPAGVLVDRWPRRRLLRWAPAGAALGFGAAAGTAWPVPLGALAFAGAGGVVLTVLTAFAALPSLVSWPDLPAANARFELARAAATLVGPPLAGICAGAGVPEAALMLAALAAFGASAASSGPDLPDTSPHGVPPLWQAIAEGARLVLGQTLLRAIAACAVLFNLAFAVQLAALVPFALGTLGLTSEQTGAAAGAYGAGLLLAALVAGPISRRVTPGVLLVFGPAVPAATFTLQALLPWPAGGEFALLALLQFGLGFGPVLWNVTRTSLQQAIVPPEALGRIGALMQVAVFGARPVGALLGGGIAAAYGPGAAMGVAAAGFALSLLPILASPLPRLRALPEAVA